MNRYDYIIAGAGAAGLSLLLHMIHSGRFADKKILLIDRALKEHNDRTWCFWEEGSGLFENVVHHKYTDLWFHGSDGTSKVHHISPYEYKMIRGEDFYRHCFGIINGFINVTIVFGNVSDVHSSDEAASLNIDGIKYSARYIFCSIMPELKLDKSEYFLWQHFKGWTIQTKDDIFDPALATLMDFRVDQKKDCRFVYVMPLSPNRALVEYTGFSEHRLEEDEYKSELAAYCLTYLRMPKENYEIVETEFGMIPMTNHHFEKAHKNIIYIGSAGGQTKASSGYTFHFIQKHSKKIVELLLSNEHPLVSGSPKKFDFYDSILLKILTEKKLHGADVFTKLFSKNEMKDVFKFLDNETSIAEDMKLISSLPTASFLSAAFPI